MPELNHKHEWRWNEWYISDGGNPVHCVATEGGGFGHRKCSAQLTMPELIERVNAFEQVVDTMIDVMSGGLERAN